MSGIARRVYVCCFAAIASASIACFTNDRSTPAEPRADGSADVVISSGGISGTTKSDTTYSLVVIDPSVTSAYPIASVHKLWVRAGGVCVLGSTYGIGHWDDPCVAATDPIAVTAKSWVDAHGHPRIDFSPSLRFVPLDGKRAAAELYMKDKAASLDASSVILWCDGTQCIDESLGDSSLITQRDKQQGFVYRRIKHFSGYELSSGRSDSTSDSTSSIQ